jgi:cell filamentation protein
MYGAMYAATHDPDCYPGGTVLKNLANLQEQSALDAFEAAMVTQRLDEPLPVGRLSYSHYRAIHRHIFGDVYPWAGRLRAVRISKGGSMFCYPENIDGEMRRLFVRLRAVNGFRGMDAPAFAEAAAHFLAELNAIHPFREGNGRTQLAFFAVIGDAAGREVHHDRLDPERMMAAMIESFLGNECLLTEAISELIRE